MAVASEGDGCIMASTTAKGGEGSIRSSEAMFVVMVGGVGIGEVVIAVVLNNGVEDTGLWTSISSRGGAQEAGVAGDESGGWVKNSTGGMRLASPVARLVVTRNGGDGDLEAVPAVLAISMDGLLSILMRDAKEPFDWLVCGFHLESLRIELQSLPANCCKRVGREYDLDWKAPSLAKVGVGDGVGE